MSMVWGNHLTPAIICIYHPHIWQGAWNTPQWATASYKAMCDDRIALQISQQKSLIFVFSFHMWVRELYKPRFTCGCCKSDRTHAQFLLSHGNGSMTGTITGRWGHTASLTSTQNRLYYERMKSLFSEALWWSVKLQSSCTALPAAVAETLPDPLESLDDTGNGSVESKNGRQPSDSYCLLSITPFFPSHTLLSHRSNMTAGCRECAHYRGQRG